MDKTDINCFVDTMKSKRQVKETLVTLVVRILKDRPETVLKDFKRHCKSFYFHSLFVFLLPLFWKTGEYDYELVFSREEESEWPDVGEEDIDSLHHTIKEDERINVSKDLSIMRTFYIWQHE